MAASTVDGPAGGTLEFLEGLNASGPENVAR
jgi:hypothetical protein